MRLPSQHPLFKQYKISFAIFSWLNEYVLPKFMQMCNHTTLPNGVRLGFILLFPFCGAPWCTPGRD